MGRRRDMGSRCATLSFSTTVYGMRPCTELSGLALVPSVHTGMRNEVGIRFDYSNPRRLWGVENGVDNVQRVYVVALVLLS